MSLHYEIEVEQQPIELYKLLKIANLVAGGGEAKVVISQGYVLLNNEVETQKRKKIFSGDIIEFNGDIVELICHTPASDSPPVKAKKTDNYANKTKNNANKHNNKNKTEKKKRNDAQSNVGKRRAIKF